jgi:hypothetical protein
MLILSLADITKPCYNTRSRNVAPESSGIFTGSRHSPCGVTHYHMPARVEPLAPTSLPLLCTFLRWSHGLCSAARASIAVSRGLYPCQAPTLIRSCTLAQKL